MKKSLLILIFLRGYLLKIIEQWHNCNYVFSCLNDYVLSFLFQCAPNELFEMYGARSGWIMLVGLGN